MEPFIAELAPSP